jgi:hypothetical protein
MVGIRLKRFENCVEVEKWLRRYLQAADECLARVKKEVTGD